jgi:hypothetical protein
MDGISSGLAVNQGMALGQASLLAVKLAARQQQQMAALLAQVSQAANPAHLGQNIDTYA